MAPGSTFERKGEALSPHDLRRRGPVEIVESGRK